jgi:hypothetical protein
MAKSICDGCSNLNYCDNGEWLYPACARREQNIVRKLARRVAKLEKIIVGVSIEAANTQEYGDVREFDGLQAEADRILARRAKGKK